MPEGLRKDTTVLVKGEGHTGNTLGRDKEITSVLSVKGTRRTDRGLLSVSTTLGYGGVGIKTSPESVWRARFPYYHCGRALKKTRDATAGQRCPFRRREATSLGARRTASKFRLKVSQVSRTTIGRRKGFLRTRSGKWAKPDDRGWLGREESQVGNDRVVYSLVRT